MRPRRSRFHRIYRRLVRGAPNRTTQWKQISLLRAEGTPGYVIHNVARHNHVSVDQPPLELPGADQSWAPAELTPEGSEPPEPSPVENQPARAKFKPRRGIIVVLLTTFLFVLACSYASMAGYMHTSDSPVGWLGVLGAAMSLAAAGVGICLSASESRRHYAWLFMTCAAVFLVGVHGALLIFVLGR
jgi:hypothetical protein